jgi:hypothetical protein
MSPLLAVFRNSTSMRARCRLLGSIALRENTRARQPAYSDAVNQLKLVFEDYRKEK